VRRNIGVWIVVREVEGIETGWSASVSLLLVDVEKYHAAGHDGIFGPSSVTCVDDPLVQESRTMSGMGIGRAPPTAWNKRPKSDIPGVDMLAPVRPSVLSSDVKRSRENDEEWLESEQPRGWLWKERIPRNSPTTMKTNIKRYANWTKRSWAIP